MPSQPESAEVATHAADKVDNRKKANLPGHPGLVVTIAGAPASDNSEDRAEATMQWDANAEEVKIWRNVAATTARPCRCCGILCGLWVASIIVLAVLVLTLGGFAFEIAVPFYNRE